jgi:hypothetical protein
MPLAVVARSPDDASLGSQFSKSASSEEEEIARDR